MLKYNRWKQSEIFKSNHQKPYWHWHWKLERLVMHYSYCTYYMMLMMRTKYKYLILTASTHTYIWPLACSGPLLEGFVLFNPFSSS